MGVWSHSVVVPQIERELVRVLRLKLLEDNLRGERLEQRLLHTHIEILERRALNHTTLFCSILQQNADYAYVYVYNNRCKN